MSRAGQLQITKTVKDIFRSMTLIECYIPKSCFHSICVTLIPRRNYLILGIFIHNERNETIIDDLKGWETAYNSQCNTIESSVILKAWSWKFRSWISKKQEEAQGSPKGRNCSKNRLWDRIQRKLVKITEIKEGGERNFYNK